MDGSARDVLPTGVRRRKSLSDGMLPLVLLGELLAGVALGAAWPRLTSPGAGATQVAPSTAVQSSVAVPAQVLPAPAALVVAPPGAHTPSAVPTARDPFSALVD